MLHPAEIVRRYATLWTHRIHTLPVVVLMPHSRCNCRCVMCDIWKANSVEQELSRDDLAHHMDAFDRLGVRWVVLSGGEPLMHENLWALCELFRERAIRVTLLSTGLLLKRHARDVVDWCDDVIVSLDGSAQVHDTIRNVPGAFDQLADGVRELRASQADFRVGSRCVVQRMNYRDLSQTVASARAIGLNQISFLAADVSSEAFNRPDRWDAARTSQVALGPDEAREFADLVEQVISLSARDFESGFIAETPDGLRRIARYFLALHGLDDFPRPVCNAPWVSTVIEADGTVRPCFFHRSLGNVHEEPLEQILNSDAAVAFRRTLKVDVNETCRTCVCTLRVSAWSGG